MARNPNHALAAGRRRWIEARAAVLIRFHQPTPTRGQALEKATAELRRLEAMDRRRKEWTDAR